MNTKVAHSYILDKLSLLTIQKEKSKNSEEFEEEYNYLKSILAIMLKEQSEENKCKIKDLYKHLKNTNENIYNAKNKIKSKEKNNKFDKEYIELNRELHSKTDIKNNIKKIINTITNSKFKETLHL